MKEFPLSDVYFSLIEGSIETLGGEFRLQPEDKEVQNAKKMLGDPPSLGPPGIVPLFVNLGLTIQRGNGTTPRVPAFLREDDMRTSVQSAKIGKDENEVIVTTLQRVIEDLSGSDKADDAGAAGRLIVVPDIRELGLGKWR